MLRFTIRDLLWLMVVVGMACALFSMYGNCHRQESEIASLEGTVRHLQSSAIFQQIVERAIEAELEKFSGKRVIGRGYHADAAGPDGYSFKFQYADKSVAGPLNRTPPSASHLPTTSPATPK